MFSSVVRWSNSLDITPNIAKHHIQSLRTGELKTCSVNGPFSSREPMTHLVNTKIEGADQVNRGLWGQECEWSKALNKTEHCQNKRNVELLNICTGG